MSGTGKSTLIRELAARGYKAIDTDYGYCERGLEGDWVWREDAIRQLLASEDADILFLSGCVSNQKTFYPQFDLVVLLSAPAETIIERLKSRTTNAYGKTEDDLAEVLENLETVEPLIRRGADYEIDTRAPVKEVADLLLEQLDGGIIPNDGLRRGLQ